MSYMPYTPPIYSGLENTRSDVLLTCDAFLGINFLMENEHEIRAFVERFFWPKIYAKRPEKYFCIMHGDIIKIVDLSSDGSYPLFDGDEQDFPIVKGHESCGLNLVIWTRVYENGVTHHELYCMAHGAKGFAAKLKNLSKWVDPADLGEVVLYFGKHKGKKLSEVPRDYLEWYVKNGNDKIKSKIEAYLEYTKESVARA